MKKEYIAKNIEHDVQLLWEKNNTFSVTEDNKKEKYYCLAMFPYPSGKLHMGHVRNYTISDVMARYQRMIGKNVLHPIGWDAFGLPAEIAAMQNNVNPSVWTDENIRYMKKQLKKLGFSYDWTREITTCKPEFYKWEQWFFIELYKKKLVYKKKSWVNWCTTDKTVLANEQVINGLCWRCNTKTTKKNISQWFIKITNYAEELLDGLNTLSEWPKKVKKMQSNWIGKLSGIEINLQLTDSKETFGIFISKPETLMKATYIAISPLHKLAKKISHYNEDVRIFLKKRSYLNLYNRNFNNNQGVDTKKSVLHPLTKEKLPIWIANYVLLECHSKAILGIPEHNQKDLDFAQTYNLKIKPTILKNNRMISKIQDVDMSQPVTLFNSKKHSNLDTKHSHHVIMSELKKNKIGKEKIYYRLKDWGVSRQRYWGVPIPMATLKNNNIIPIPKKFLPIILPEHINITEYNITSRNKSNQKEINIDGQLAICESDTLDTFVESSWYYARYTCPTFRNGMIDKSSSNYWLPVDLYIGGIEHATMHLIYFRFFHKLLRDFGLVKSDEPVKKLLCQGMVLSDAFYYLDEDNRKHWINISSNNFQYDINGNIKKSFKYCDKIIFHSGMMKMSKSKKNGIEPEKMINKYGADTVRLFIMFAAPVEASLEWTESGVKGMHRFLKKIWTFCYNHVKKYKHLNTKTCYKNLTDNQKILYSFLYTTIQKVEQDISKKQSFNTAIAEIMKLVNKLFNASSKQDFNLDLTQKFLLSIIKMLYPFTPHFSHVLLTYLLHEKENITEISWPKFNKNYTINNFNIILIQINGKLRHKISVSKIYSKQEILEIILKEPKVSRYTDNSKIHDVIYIPNKLINLVIN
ncbi:MAG: leucine--tRNA ligase [Buchnera aphidicola (Melaphis rhois)]